jgi:hypothetical protein
MLLRYVGIAVGTLDHTAANRSPRSAAKVLVPAALGPPNAIIGGPSGHAATSSTTRSVVLLDFMPQLPRHVDLSPDTPVRGGSSLRRTDR